MTCLHALGRHTCLIRKEESAQDQRICGVGTVQRQAPAPAPPASNGMVGRRAGPSRFGVTG